jgi:pimeloyl-ACP methyl ester carboxylesterase
MPISPSAALLRRPFVRAALRRAARIDSPSGVVESGYVPIGGVDQWISIRGEDRANPVLLVLHGGPGSPYDVFTPLLRSWERHFTVVHWDRRGAGRTLTRSGRPDAGDLTFDRMVEDGVEVAEHLQERLGKDKILLMAGSMGLMVGLPLVQRRPDLFSAFVSTDFYVDMVANEAQALQDTLARLRATGRSRGVRALEALDPDPRTWDERAWSTRMQWSMATDPSTPNAVTRLILPMLLTNPGYRLRDAKAWLSGFAECRRRMFDQFMAFDARRSGTAFEVPFVLIQGASDVVTLTEPAIRYAEEVSAPAKYVSKIEGASHFCAFSHPEEFLRALREATAAVGVR